MSPWPTGLMVIIEAMVLTLGVTIDLDQTPTHMTITVTLAQVIAMAMGTTILITQIPMTTRLIGIHLRIMTLVGVMKMIGVIPTAEEIAIAGIGRQRKYARQTNTTSH